LAKIALPELSPVAPETVKLIFEGSAKAWLVGNEKSKEINKKNEILLKYSSFQ
jgi:hypothetical protein